MPVTFSLSETALEKFEKNVTFGLSQGKNTLENKKEIKPLKTFSFILYVPVPRSANISYNTNINAFNKCNTLNA